MSGREEVTVGGKPLSSLRVVDLKAELDKLGMSKSGSKKELSDRLKNHLVIERERQGVAGGASTTDEEQLPNISMQDKLAEDNPFIREYFASQAELFHSQKVVKKLYQEEKKRESEGSGTSADEREKSPVKSVSEPTSMPISDSPVNKRGQSGSGKNGEVEAGPEEDVINASEEPEKSALPPPPAEPVLSTRGTRARVQSSEAPPEVPTPVETAEPVNTAAESPKKQAIEAENDKQPEDPQPGKAIKTPEERLKVPGPVAAEKKLHESVLAPEPVKEQKKAISGPEPVKEPKKVISGPEPVKEPKKVISAPEPVKEPKKVISAPDPYKEPRKAILAPDPVKEPKKAISAPKPVASSSESSDEDEKESAKDESSSESESEIRSDSASQDLLVAIQEVAPVPIQSEPPPEDSAPPPPKKQAIEIIVETPKEAEGKEVKPRPKRIPITFDLDKVEAEPIAKKGPIRTISFSKDDGRVIQSTGSKIRQEIQAPEPAKVVVVLNPGKVKLSSTRSSTEVNPGKVRLSSTRSSTEVNPGKVRLSSTRSSTEVTAPIDEVLDYEEEDDPAAPGEKKEEPEPEAEEVFNMDDYVPILIEVNPRPLNLKSNIHSQKRSAAREAAVKADPGIDGWKDKCSHKDLTLEDLEKWYPDTDWLTDEESRLELEESALLAEFTSPLLEIDETFRITRTFSNVEESPEPSAVDTSGEVDLRRKVEAKRKVSMVSIVSNKEDETEKDPTPPRGTPGPIIIVTNLVRPFTVPQLNDLLQRTGNVVDLWVDRIKSKCVAKYDTDEAAIETRTALHGVRWPLSNPKCLSVDFSTEKDLQDYRRKDSGEIIIKVENKPDATQPVREWDMGKKRKASRSPADRDRRRSSSRDRKRPRRSASLLRRRHSRSPHTDRKDRGGDVKEKLKKHEPSGKALDELFRKTVATPCIYWLPLNPSQIAEKEDLRRKRMEERERRISELQKHRQR